MLTDEQRAELEALGPESVRGKMIPCAVTRDADVAGFKTGDDAAGYLLRGDLEDWLAEKSAREATERKQTLRWAKIAGWSAIIGVGVGIVAILVAIWLAR